ncbi:hypothetical protein J45TS6_12450 [Paenibacillus sp. J45TS6]|nr:hypothetical protein J45TS6_12450 [Paenibacillus sp. J45TS6]
MSFPPERNVILIVHMVYVNVTIPLIYSKKMCEVNNVRTNRSYNEYIYTSASRKDEDNERSSESPVMYDG